MIEKIAIVGFRGVGKSMVSSNLQNLSHLPLYALDKIIETTEGHSIASIVKDNGWMYFRDLETKILREYCNKNRGILDCGGGILEGPDGNFSEEKYNLLKKNFYCIYLFLDDDKLIGRLKRIKKNKSRPALSSDLRQTLEKRKPWFEKLADHSIDTHGITPAKLAEMIYERIKKVNA